EMYASRRGIGRLIFTWGEGYQIPQRLRHRAGLGFDHCRQRGDAAWRAARRPLLCQGFRRLMPVIEVSKLGKDFSAGRVRVRALADVSFSVEEGQFVTLVGPSGCGKSTLLQILAGLIAATSGEARIEGERICAPMPDKIGMVFQDPTLLPWKTALANVE